jgi:hypothetical protein
VPLYRDFHLFDHSQHVNFSHYFMPGEPATDAGIYKCHLCGFETVARRGEPLPNIWNCTEHNPGLWNAPAIAATDSVTWHLVAIARDSAMAD